MRKKPDIACKNCGKLFHPKRKESVFCCRECASEYNKVHGVFKKSDEQKAKLSAAHKGKTPWNKGIPISEEQKVKFRESIKRVWTEEKKEEQRQKQKEVWSDKELLEKHSKQAAERMKNNPEIKKKIAKSVHEYNKKLNKEQWTDRYIKSYETKIKNNSLYESNIEKEIREYIVSLGLNVSKYIIGKSDDRFEIDIYIEDKKIGIEYNGIYYHATNGRNLRNSRYHYNKSRKANELGIDLIHIWEDQWKYKSNILKDILRVRLGIMNKNRVYARECEIKDIDTKTYREFCINNHIQGYARASIKLGLYYKDELVQIASFNRPRSYGNNKEDIYDYEWIRGATKLDISVIGGTSRLFSYFIKTYNPKNVLCYCDYNLFTGSGYEKCGFKLLSYTGPDLFFIVNSSTLLRVNRNPYDNTKQKQLVAEGKLYECHGCGSKKYVWYRKE